MTRAVEGPDRASAVDAPPGGLRDHQPSPVPRPRAVAPVAVLLGLAAIAALWAGFTGAGPAQLDAHVLGESVRFRTDARTGAAVAVTTLGSTVSMAVLAVVAGVRLWWTGRRADAALAVGVMVGAAVLFTGLKELLDRPRPPQASWLVHAADESLPSGHATMSMVVIGTLVVLASAGRTVVVRALAVGAGALGVGTVGLTRVYLGVHWFSDVLAGWLVGGAWLALCAVVWSWWHTRGSPLASAHAPVPPEERATRTGGPLLPRRGGVTTSRTVATRRAV